jgi:hypothetical protein
VHFRGQRVSVKLTRRKRSHRLLNFLLFIGLRFNLKRIKRVSCGISRNRMSTFDFISRNRPKHSLELVARSQTIGDKKDNGFYTYLSSNQVIVAVLT